MWQFTNPLYGWALLTLAVPVVIHLKNRFQSKVKILGSIGWLKEIQQTKSHFRHIQQWLLLLIRLTLFSVVVLLLTGLFLEKTEPKTDQHKTIILIHPDYHNHPQLQQLTQAWTNDSVKVHWLSAGFPEYSQIPDRQNIYSTGSLLTEADSWFQADSFHLIAPNRADYYQGTTPSLAASFSYESLEEISPDTIRLAQALLNNQNSELIWFRSDSLFTGFISQTKSDDFPETAWTEDRKSVKVKTLEGEYQISAKNTDTLKIHVIAENYPNEKNIFQRAVKAVAEYHHVPLQFSEENNADWIAIFDKGKPLKHTSKLVWIYAPANGVSWIETVQHDSLVIRKELTTAEILQGGFLQELRHYILAFKYKTIPHANIDYRKMDVLAWVNQKQVNQKITKTDNKSIDRLSFWLGIIALALFALERFLPKK
jgi:hypothetical protein